MGNLWLVRALPQALIVVVRNAGKAPCVQSAEQRAPRASGCQALRAASLCPPPPPGAGDPDRGYQQLITEQLPIRKDQVRGGRHVLNELMRDRDCAARAPPLTPLPLQLLKSAATPALQLFNVYGPRGSIPLIPGQWSKDALGPVGLKSDHWGERQPCGSPSA